MSVADDFFNAVPGGEIQEDDVPRDGHGRYLLPDPVTGEIKGRTRVTTIAGVLDSGYGLGPWKLRQVARGMGLRPDLMARAGVADPEDPGYDKLLTSIAASAFEAAGGNVGSNLGSAQHKALERYFGGTSIEDLPEYFHPDLIGVRDALAVHGIEILPEYLERTVYCSQYDRGGKIDGIARLKDGSLVIIDWKTEKDPVKYPEGKTIQEAFYNHSNLMMNYQTQQYEPMPAVRQDIALVIWCPPGTGQAKVFQVPTLLGWQGAWIAESVRAWRQQKIVISEYMSEANWAPKVVSQPIPMAQEIPGAQEKIIANAITPEGRAAPNAFLSGVADIRALKQEASSNGNSTQIKEIIDQQIQSGQQVGPEQVTQLNNQAAALINTVPSPFVPNSNPALASAGLPQGPAQPPGLPVPPGPQPPGISKNASPAELLADFLGRTGKGIEPDVFYEEMIAELAELTKPQLQDMLRLIQPGVDENSLKKHRKPLAERLTGLIKDQHDMRGREESKQPELPYEITAAEQGAPEEIPLVEPAQTAPWSQPQPANGLIDMSFEGVMRAIDEAPNMDRLGAIYQQWVGTYGPQGWVGQILDAANAKATQLQLVPTH
jgi:hypothetical protein